VTTGPGVAPLFERWQLGNERLVAALRPLTAEQLTLPVGSPTWPELSQRLAPRGRSRDPYRLLSNRQRVAPGGSPEETPNAVLSLTT
jgi:hypothetical protein